MNTVVAKLHQHVKQTVIVNRETKLYILQMFEKLNLGQVGGNGGGLARPAIPALPKIKMTISQQLHVNYATK